MGLLVVEAGGGVVVAWLGCFAEPMTNGCLRSLVMPFGVLLQ